MDYSSTSINSNNKDYLSYYNDHNYNSNNKDDNSSNSNFSKKCKTVVVSIIPTPPLSPVRTLTCISSLTFQPPPPPPFPSQTLKLSKKGANLIFDRETKKISHFVLKACCRFGKFSFLSAQLLKAASSRAKPSSNFPDCPCVFDSTFPCNSPCVRIEFNGRVGGTKMKRSIRNTESSFDFHSLKSSKSMCRLQSNLNDDTAKFSRQHFFKIGTMMNVFLTPPSPL